MPSDILRFVKSTIFLPPCLMSYHSVVSFQSPLMTKELPWSMTLAGVFIIPLTSQLVAPPPVSTNLSHQQSHVLQPQKIIGWSLSPLRSSRHPSSREALPTTIPHSPSPAAGLLCHSDSPSLEHRVMVFRLFLVTDVLTLRTTRRDVSCALPNRDHTRSGTSWTHSWSSTISCWVIYACTMGVRCAVMGTRGHCEGHRLIPSRISSWRTIHQQVDHCYAVHRWQWVF